jgi:hypothetical protein
MLGNGFVAWVDPPVFIPTIPYRLEVMDLAGTRAVHSYGPLPTHPSYWWGAVDEAGAPRLVYVDPEGRLRRVDLNWLSSAPKDVTPPAQNSLSGTERVVATTRRTTGLTFSWSYTDRGTGAVPPVGGVQYEVRYQQAAGDGDPYAAWVQPAGWAALTTSAVRLTVPVDTDTCFSVRARDGAGNTGDWSTPRCTAVLHDDGTLKASGKVARRASTLGLAHTVSRMDRRGATLEAKTVTARRIVLVVLAGPGQGSVDVYLGSKFIGSVHLSAASWTRRVVTLDAGRARSGKLSIRSSSTKPVRIDAWGVRHH